MWIYASRPLNLDSDSSLAIENALGISQNHGMRSLHLSFLTSLERIAMCICTGSDRSMQCTRPIDDYPAEIPSAAAIMLMIQNNLDPEVAQYPHEL